MVEAAMSLLQASPLAARYLGVQDIQRIPCYRVPHSFSTRKLHTAVRRGMALVAASQKEKDKEPTKPAKELRIVERLVSRLALSPGLLGTVAMIAGRLLDTDPFGNLHWSSHDVLLGAAWAIPVLAVDFAFVLRDYIPQRTDTTASVPSSMGAASSSGAGAMREGSQASGIEEAATSSAQKAVAAAEARLQAHGVKLVTRDLLSTIQGARRPGRRVRPSGLAPFQGRLVVPVPGLPAAAAVLQVLLFSLGVEMFQRGIVVQGLGGWLTDRLAEAGLDEFAYEAYLGAVPADGAVVLALTGQILAFLLFLSLLAWMNLSIARLEIMTLRLSQKRARETEESLLRKMRLRGGPGVAVSEAVQSLRVQDTFEEMQQEMLAGTGAAIRYVSLQQICATAPFIMTGNLAASYTAHLAMAFAAIAVSYVDEHQRQRKMASLRAAVMQIRRQMKKLREAEAQQGLEQQKKQE